jgi:adenine-specific DNA-methyltransferase
MVFLDNCEISNRKASSILTSEQKSKYGQYFTSSSVAKYMASLFNRIEGDVRLLDPGAGTGILTAAFVAEGMRRGNVKSYDIATYDIEPQIQSYLEATLSVISQNFKQSGISFKSSIRANDFILDSLDIEKANFSTKQNGIYSHVIVNPPYKKINSASQHRKLLSEAGIEAANLYSAFVGLAIKLLRPGGELVAIIPRSFCNGPYYQSFRNQIVKSTAIKNIHLFHSRTAAFSEDRVQQENIIIHCIKDCEQGSVSITSSKGSDFYLDNTSKGYTTSDFTKITIPFTDIVKTNDNKSIFYISANDKDKNIVNRISKFTTSLEELDVEVSTGPVVDFRLKTDLRNKRVKNSVPLLYPTHLNGKVRWPLESKKPNAILVSKASKRWLMNNEGSFVLIKRMSSKEEQKRIQATYYDGSLPGKLIGFDNKLNVIHYKKSGIDKSLAIGIALYLNSTLVDEYYRQYGGHTQVNVSDLKILLYPSANTLRVLGEKVSSPNALQSEIDDLLEKILCKIQ